eukprot:2494264-Rhodomonas_salina.1
MEHRRPDSKKPCSEPEILQRVYTGRCLCVAVEVDENLHRHRHVSRIHKTTLIVKSAWHAIMQRNRVMFIPWLCAVGPPRWRWRMPGNCSAFKASLPYQSEPATTPELKHDHEMKCKSATPLTWILSAAMRDATAAGVLLETSTKTSQCCLGDELASDSNTAQQVASTSGSHLLHMQACTGLACRGLGCKMSKRERGRRWRKVGDKEREREQERQREPGGRRRKRQQTTQARTTREAHSMGTDQHST